MSKLSISMKILTYWNYSCSRTPSQLHKFHRSLSYDNLIALQYNGLFNSHFSVLNQIPNHVIVDQANTSIKHILQYSTQHEWINIHMIEINSHVHNSTTVLEWKSLTTVLHIMIDLRNKISLDD